jgi:16S rRNA (guanine527-N7)-methyltransferase
VHADLSGTRIADVGTGAGFPGLPLAAVQPQRAFTLIDANQKKLRFVTHAVRVLELANVTPLHARVERLAPEAAFDTVIARAFAPLPELLAQVRGLAGPATRVLAMKGRLHPAELAAVADPWRIIEQRPLEVPGLGEARHLVVLGQA